MRKLFVEDGLNMTEIGNRYGLTRERVRQVMGELGVDTSVVIRHWAQRKQREAEDATAREREAAEAQRRASLLQPVEVVHGDVTYTDEELLDELRKASKEQGGGQPSSVTWSAARRLPSAATYVLRFGSWQRACELAGVASRKAPVRRSAWPDEEVAAVVLEFLSDADNAKGGGPQSYDQWREGKGYPSSATIRQRFGGWRAARNAAVELSSK
jgi:hypothetical protein